MIEILQREAIYLWYYFSVQFQQIIGYYILGMALGSFVSVFCKEKINRMFVSLQSSKLGVLGIVPAALLGLASPLCMYGTVPLAASFAEKGMEEDAPSREGELAAFMMGSVLLNPQLLFYTAALGAPAVVIRFVCCFLCGVTAGILVRYFFRKKKFFDFSGFSSEDENRDKDPILLFRFLKNYGRNIKATVLFFIVGIALSAIFQRYVPPEGFARLFGNRGFGLLMAATVGVPLYVCGGGTIPLLQTWLHQGMSMGSAAAFMITGPAAKLTNLGALKIVLGIKNFMLYLLFAIVFALICGFVINIILFF
uniref:Permease n=1 Tax=uncultured bacterium contig00056 TaxID=1181540 RepID=A0A806JYV7_9BACT|nr:hypothetical protein [uncultured bacterium contig00056]